RYPADLTRPSRDLRTSSSSSTMSTIGAVLELGCMADGFVVYDITRNFSPIAPTIGIIEFANKAAFSI
ncbi:hypothetical protein, partial [Rhizobium mayense]